MSRLTGVLGGMALLGGALTLQPADAHHSFAQFDMTKTETIHGTLYVVEWTNPHSWLWIKADDGVKWGFEAGAPAQLVRNGFPRSSLKVGSPLTVTYHPVRNPKTGNGGSMVTVRFDDGREITGGASIPKAGGGPGGPGPGPGAGGPPPGAPQ